MNRLNKQYLAYAITLNLFVLTHTSTVHATNSGEDLRESDSPPAADVAPVTNPLPDLPTSPPPPTLQLVPAAPAVPAIAITPTPVTPSSLPPVVPNAKASQEDAECYENVLLFARVMQLVRERYVDDKKTGYTQLTHAALKGMLNSLDPHSQFLDESGFQEIQRETKGEFTGLGITVGSKNGYLVILQPMQNSPGERAGILPGDRIMSINGKDAEKMSLADANALLRGLPGEKATLTLLRPEAGAPNGGSVYKVDIVRETIRLTSVKDDKILPAELTGPDMKIGYVRIEEFEEKTGEELDNALAKMQSAGMQGLVIDLRNNPGGLLDVAVDVAGKFLPPGTVVVSTRGRKIDQVREYVARNQTEQPNYPMAILINGYSASGAEIMAGALKDLDRAVLVGETTFGKGSVQTIEPLGNGIGIRLTTARYYTPSKRSIQEVGIIPDIPVTLSDEDERRVALTEVSRPLSPDEQIEVSKLKDTPLLRAITALKTLQQYPSQGPGSAAVVSLKASAGH